MSSWSFTWPPLNTKPTCRMTISSTSTSTARARLIEASKRAGVERFVYGSTIGVYGEYADGPLDENTPPRPLNIYGRSKLAAEEVVKSHRGELPMSIVRISETYGPGDFRLLKLFRALDRGRFLIIGSGQNQRQAIHVRDLVQGLLLAATHPAAVGETFVLAGQETMTTREMVEHVAACTRAHGAALACAAMAVPRSRRGDGEDPLAVGYSAAAAPPAPGFLSQILRILHGQSAAGARL